MRPVQGRRRQQHAARQLIQPWRAEALRQRSDPGRVPADRRQAAAGESGIWPAQRAAGARPWPHPRGGRHGLHPAAPAQCAAAAAPAAGSCWPMRRPADNRHEATPTVLAAACRESVPGMCLQLADRWHDEARAPATPDEAQQQALLDTALAGIELPMPCRNGGFSNETPACAAALEADPALREQIVKAAMGAAMVEAVSSVLSPSTPVVVPAAQRQQLLQLCQQVGHGGFCSRVAELSWESGDPLQAVQALTTACAPGKDSAACERLPALQALGASLRPQPATALPCGTFRAAGGLMDTLDFGDAGRVGIGWDSQLRARVEDGDIRIRHDKGGDFVLRPLPGASCWAWTRGHASGVRADRRGREHLQPAETLHGAAAAAGLPAGAGQRRCRSLLRAGQAAGLQHSWQPSCAVRPVATGGRALHHRVPCRRARGLRNLVAAQGRSSDVDAHATLERLCAADRSGRHVACDVLDTGNWSARSWAASCRRRWTKRRPRTLRRRALPTASAEPARACPQRWPGPAVKYAP